MDADTEFCEALEEYDRQVSRARIARLVKQLRVRGLRVTEIREALDERGVPMRVELRAGHAVVWQYERLDVALDGMAKPRHNGEASRAAESDEDDSDDNEGRFGCL